MGQILDLVCKQRPGTVTADSYRRYFYTRVQYNSNFMA